MPEKDNSKRIIRKTAYLVKEKLKSFDDSTKNCSWFLSPEQATD